MFYNQEAVSGMKLDSQEIVPKLELDHLLSCYEAS